METMVAQTHLKFMLCVHCLSCFYRIYWCCQYFRL